MRIRRCRESRAKAKERKKNVKWAPFFFRDFYMFFISTLGRVQIQVHGVFCIYVCLHLFTCNEWNESRRCVWHRRKIEETRNTEKINNKKHVQFSECYSKKKIINAKWARCKNEFFQLWIDRSVAKYNDVVMITEKFYPINNNSYQSLPRNRRLCQQLAN